MALKVTAEARTLAAAVTSAEAADLYLYSGPVNETGYGMLVRQLRYVNPAAILLLSTYGGSANSAYRIGRLLQSVYGGYTVFICSYCKSAGTLVATGASRILMTEAAELGPLDVQLRKRDELWEQRSGLLLRSALTSLSESSDELFTKIMVSIKTNSGGDVSFRLASRIASRITEGLMAGIYSQITPDGLGQDYQDLQVAVEYAKRLASVGGLISPQSIRHLVHNYPSHDFVIDKMEAKALFGAIGDATDEMYKLAVALSTFAYAPDNREVTVDALHVKPQTDTAGGSAEVTPHEEAVVAENAQPDAEPNQAAPPAA